MTNETNGTPARVRHYIVDNFLYARPDFQFLDSDALFGQGIIDSFGASELLAFLESEFRVTIHDHEVTEEHLGSVDAISRFVDGKLKSSGVSLA
jgi:acyl carrier protein